MVWSMDGNREMDVADVCLWEGEEECKGTCVVHSPGVIRRDGNFGEQNLKARARPCNRCSSALRYIHHFDEKMTSHPYNHTAVSMILKTRRNVRKEVRVNVFL